MDRLEKWARIRIRVVGLVFCLAFVLIAAHAFRLQVFRGEELKSLAERQHQKIIPLTPQRGAIYDRNGEELAISVEVDSIYVEPGKVPDPEAQAPALARALGMPRAAMLAKLKSDKGFMWLKRQVLPRVREEVFSLNIPGVNAIKEHRRYYPNSEIGAQVVGFTGLDPRGLEGLELAYDGQVLGQGGYLVTERDALGRGLGSGDPMVRQGRRGQNLYLTLDKTLQYITEKELIAGVRDNGARAGVAILVEPASGQVLAMASAPNYNPNAIYKHSPGDWRNRAVCDSFEPGSTLKVFLLAAALDAGVVQAKDRIYCEKGSYRVAGKVIHDHHDYEFLTPEEILKYSSNIGAAKIGRSLEREGYYRYLREFGFARKTGIDLPGEVEGLLRKPSQWFDMDLAAISFGQGLAVTPLQLAMATASIANGGRLMRPYVVDRIVDPKGTVVEKRWPKTVRQVVSPAVSQQLRKMMITTTEAGGTGTLAAVPGYRVAGKTGTAQKVDPVTGGYSVDKRIASFVGFVPAEEPRLALVVVIDEPSDKTYGGLVAAPIFSRIAAQSLHYLKVPASQPVPQRPLPELAELASTPAVPPAQAAAATVRWTEAGDAPSMPDLLGMSYRQVLQAMEQRQLNIRLHGSGRVVEQSPLPGEPIRYGAEVWVKLSAPLANTF